MFPIALEGGNRLHYAAVQVVVRLQSFRVLIIEVKTLLMHALSESKPTTHGKRDFRILFATRASRRASQIGTRLPHDIHQVDSLALSLLPQIMLRLLFFIILRG